MLVPASLSHPPPPPWLLDRRLGPGLVDVGVLPGPLWLVGPGVRPDDPLVLGLEDVDLLGPCLVVVGLVLEDLSWLDSPLVLHHPGLLDGDLLFMLVHLLDSLLVLLYLGLLDGDLLVLLIL